MDIDSFVRDREDRWLRLEQLLTVAESSQVRELGRERLLEIVTLYRQVGSDLIRARTMTANPDLLGRLNQLAGRAYRFVHAEAPRRERGSLSRFLREDVPRSFRAQHRHVVLSAASMLVGVALGAVAVVASPDNTARLVPAMFYTESPRERAEKVESSDERIDTVESALSYSAQLSTHNIRVAFLAFSLAALTIAGGCVILFHNGVILGAVAASYHLDGASTFFYAWVGPHGALEIPAILLAGAAGFVLGEALLFPGDISRSTSIRKALPPSWRLLATSALVLVAAGLIEGSFSQFTARTVAFEVKIAVAVVLAIGLVAWLVGGGRGDVVGHAAAAAPRRAGSRHDP